MKNIINNLKHIPPILWVILAFLVVLALAALVSDPVTTKVPCEAYANYRMENLPARCFEHFGGVR